MDSRYGTLQYGSVLVSALGLLSFIVLLGLCTNLAYNLFFHPLRHYPGPPQWAVSRLPYAINDVQGRVHHRILSIHQKYGPVVRISPDELSYTTDTAWATIYGNRPGKPEMLKAHQLPRLETGSRSMVTVTDTEQHRLQRGVAQHAFTDEALRQQEHYIQHFADLLIEKLKARPAKEPVDLVPWLNWTTFDIIGDIAFGQPFGCLENTENHMWVSAVFQMFKFLPIFQALNYYGLASLVQKVAPKKRLQGWKNVQAFTHQVMEKRLARPDTEDRKDFVHFMRQERKGYKLDNAQLESEANTLVVAGSETSATAMAGVFYCLLSNPAAYAKVKDEVRTRFADDSRISMTSALELRYLHAVILEAMRLYPPAVVTFPRVVPEPGEIIEGKWVPSGYAVGIHHLSAYHSRDNWMRPEEYLPERWLECEDPSSGFYNDKRGVLQPFSYGPRNCLGRGMAWAEMHIIVAKLLWHFDMELDGASRGWTDQKIYLVWEKRPLMVKLKAVERG